MDQKKNRSIKILIASHIGKPWGGISTLFEAILKSSLKDKLDLRFIETSINRLGSGNGKPGGLAILHSIKAVIAFTITLVKRRPDIVHIATAHKGSFIKHGLMVLVARLLRIKIILAPHCGVTALLPNNSPSYWKYWVKFILQRCDCILVLSREWLIYPSLMDNNKVRYLPNAIQTHDLSSISRYLSNQSKFTSIVFLGHISKEKGLLDLIEAASILSISPALKFSIDLVGEGIEANEFEEIIQAIQERQITSIVKIRKPEFGRDKFERLRLADIFVLPSHNEGMPMTILEAMAAGLPVVATSVGGIPELIENGQNGLLVPANSPDQLAEALMFLIQSPLLRLQMGEKGRKKVLEYYDIEKYVEKLENIYHEVANLSDGLSVTIA